MGCGCGGKNKAGTSVRVSRMRYSANGSRKWVRLGLKSCYPLPFKFSKAIDSRDVLVVANNIKISPPGNAIVIVGHNAWVIPEHKSQLVARWPHVFEHD
jgi:hypothetical protein